MKHTLYLIFGILLLSAATSVYYPLTVDNTLIYDESTNSLSVDTTKLATRYYSGSLTGGGAEYLVYTALISQSGTDAPTATVLENTLGGTVVWTYNDVGNYSGTLTGAFTTNTLIFPVYAGFNSQLYLDPYTTINNSYFPDAINLQTGEVDSYLNNTLIEIRVY